MSESIHAVIFWLLCAGVFVAWYAVGNQAARLFMHNRGVQPGRLSRPLAGLLVATYAVAVYGALAALVGCPYLEAIEGSGVAQLVAMSPVGLLVLALAAKLRPVIAGMGRGEPVVVVHEATLPGSSLRKEPTDELKEAEPVGEPEAPRIFDRDGLADTWAAIDARQRTAA